MGSGLLATLTGKREFGEACRYPDSEPNPKLRPQL
jgi:hypothetical protein